MSSFKYNPAVEKALARLPQVKAAVKEVSDEIAQGAQQIAREEAYAEGDYHDSIKALEPVETQAYPWLEGAVIATDWKSHLIEFGTETQSAVAPLRRAAEQATQ